MNPYRPSFQERENLIRKGAMKMVEPVKKSTGKGWNPGKPKMFSSNTSATQQGLTSFFGQS